MLQDQEQSVTFLVTVIYCSFFIMSFIFEQWDATENKPMVVIYGGGAVVGVWLASTVIDAINGVPVVRLRNITEFPDWYISKYTYTMNFVNIYQWYPMFMSVFFTSRFQSSWNL